jgi:hypothetical protein
MFYKSFFSCKGLFKSLCTVFSAKMAEFRLKRLNARSYISKLAEIFPNSPNRRTKTNYGSNFGQIDKNSAKIGGGN